MKEAGKISRLEAMLAAKPVHGTTGIAHTRWATHGPPNEVNAHPHVSDDGTIAVVHNGIIENATVAQDRCSRARGYVFRSDTDTEVLAHLIEEAFDGNLEDAVIEALRQVEGTYGIAVISSIDPDKIVAARKGSPLLIGLGDGEYFVASDVSAILAHTRKVVYLDDGEMAVVDRNGYRVVDLNATAIKKKVVAHRLGPRADRARRVRALHAQGDLRAAADAREHDARPPARSTKARRSSAD